jgi:WD40 repeat protein
LLISLSIVVEMVAMSLALYHLGKFPGQASTTRQGSAIVVLAPSLQGDGCLEDQAWSPDGRQVAVLGYRQQCPSELPDKYDYQPGEVNIYSAVTGQLVRTILPDPTVLALPAVLPLGKVQPASANSDISKRDINYRDVIWSPDSKRLALIFVVDLYIAGGISASGLIGLAVMHADGTHERATVINDANQDFAALRWDTTTADYLPLPVLQPAMRYSWSANGLLVPSGSLTSATSPASIGNPDGGESFTIWQPGSIYLNSLPSEPGVYTLLTPILPWSPDGRFLITSIDLDGVLHPLGKPNPPPRELKAMSEETAPSVAIRDPALQRLLASLNDNNSVDDIAWSPNGRVLAASMGDNSLTTANGSTTSAPVIFYDCATGRTIGTLQPQPAAHVPLNQALGANLLWSSDGSHFLTYSALLNTITIWGPSMLPKSAQEH